MPAKASWLMSVVLVLVGAGLSGGLLQLHAEGAGLLAPACEGGGCDAVLTSRWSVLPPASVQPAGVEPGPPVGLPVAALGLFYFTVIGVALLGLGPRLLELPGARRWLLLGCVCGCVGSLGFLGTMAFAIGSFCVLCGGVHVANGLLCGVVFLAGRREVAPAVEPREQGSHEPGRSKRRNKRKKGKQGKKETQPEPPPEARESGFPPRLLAVCGVAALALCLAEWALHRASLAEVRGEAARAALERYTADGSQLEVSYFQGQQQQIEVRPDDPLIAASPGTRMTLVLWSDMLCSGCARFEGFLSETIRPLFAGHLRVVYKHFPRAGKLQARALEAARLQGRFWEMHDLMLARRAAKQPLLPEPLARELGLDLARFRADLQAPSTQQRIDADMAQGRALGVTGTPTAFLNGRRLDPLMRILPGFWQLRAKALREARATRGQPW